MGFTYCSNDESKKQKIQTTGRYFNTLLDKLIGVKAQIILNMISFSEQKTISYASWESCFSMLHAACSGNVLKRGEV